MNKKLTEVQKKNLMILTKRALVFFIACAVLLCTLFFEGSINCFLNRTGFYLDKNFCSSNVRVHFIDVGQGDCTFLQVGGKSIMIDVGTQQSSGHIKDYLDNLGVKIGSCIDYLIYELVYIKEKVRNAINLCDLNKERYKNYLKNIQDNTVRYTFDEEIGTLNKDLLYKFEDKILSQILQKPTHKFEITVKLTQTKINGKHVCSKSKSFNKYEILVLIDELNNKRNGYYLNEDIWEAICMVERGKVSNKMRFAIYKRDGYRCRCCGRRTKDLEIDHIVPISKGGKSTYDNLQTLCRRCNKLKGTKTVRY